MTKNNKNKTNLEFVVKVSMPCIDKETGRPLNQGDILTTKDFDRFVDIIDRHLGSIKEIRNKRKKNGKKITVYHELLAPIGGIETALYYRSKTFPKADITFVFRMADLQQALRLARNHNILIDDGLADLPDADVLIVDTYNGYEQIKGRIRAKKIYQVCHSDWNSLKKVSQTFKNYDWHIDTDINKVIAVSDTVQKSLKTAFKTPIESIVVRNIPPEPDKNFRTFLTLSRFTQEKGGERTLKMIQRFREDGRHFLWIFASNYDSTLKKSLLQDPDVLFVKPSIVIAGMVGKVDYLVQLSDSESFGYSVHEAIAVGTPVIGTRIPENEKVIKDGKNGYLVNLDLSDLNVRKIFEEKPHAECIQEPLDSNWERLLNGEL